MDCIQPIKLAQFLAISAGLCLAANYGSVAIAQVPPSVSNPVTAGVAPVAQPAYAPVTYGGSSGASLLSSMDALNDQVKLQPGDVVSYRVIEEQDATPDVLTVSDTGEIEIPLLGRYQASGKTCRQLANQLKPILEKDYFYKATVIVAIDTRSTKPLGQVYLTGQVKSQGAIPIPANETLTVSQAILLDGGLADFADRRRIRLLHHEADTGKTTTTIVDLKEILDRGHSEKDPVVQAGDTINVPQRLINF